MTVDLLSIKDIFDTDPKDLPIDSLPEVHATLQKACKVCQSKHTKLINHLLTLQASDASIVRYCNKHNLFGDKPLSDDNVGVHKRKHLEQVADLPDVVTEGALKAVEAQVAALTADERLELIETAALLPVYAGKKTPSIMEALQARRIRNEDLKGKQDQVINTEVLKNLQLKNKKLEKETAPVIEVIETTEG